MKNENVETTHIGWLKSPSEGDEGSDHLVVKETLKEPKPKKSPAILEFVDKQQENSDSLGVNEASEDAFLEVNSTCIESPVELLAANDQGVQFVSEEIISFNNENDPNTINETFN